MKKILSTLVMCLILGVGSVWAKTVGGSATPILISGNAATTGKGGQVKVVGESDDNVWTYGTDSYSASTSGLSREHMYMHAKADDGFYFVGWAESYSANGQYTLIQNYQSSLGLGFSVSGNSSSNPLHYAATSVATSGENITRYAIFKPVTVDAMTIDGEAITSKTLNSTDKNGYKEATIVFTTAHADNWNDFVNDAVVLEGDGRFKIQSYNRDGNTVTVVVRFTDDDHHVMDGTLPSATVTLTSKGDATSKKTATITATSDLTPKTTITPSPCDLTPSSPVLAGNTVSATLNVAAAVGYTNVVAAATITAVEFTNPEDAELKGYTLDATDPKAPVVSFTPTEFSINQANVETEICVTTAYTDANDKVITHTECVTITADAGKVITIGGVKDAVMDFGIIDYTETNVPVSIEYPIYSTLAATAFKKTETGFTTDISHVVNKFTGSGATDDKLTVTVNSTLVPNDYTATLTYTEDGADPISASLTVKVSIKLAKPVVTATVPDGNVTLTWPAVYGANRYIIKSEGVEIATITETTYKVTNIGGQELTKGRQYSFTVTAVYGDNPEKGNRESDIAYATPGIPTVITYGDIDDINMYTGTEMGAGNGGVYESFPYSKKRPISLDNVFDEITNAPLFDFLYIFGITTNQDDGNTINNTLASTTTPCNAKTPCYMYRQSDGKYVLDSEFDAVTTRFDHQKNMGNKKLYFTGYCPFANIGTQVNDEGWMYFIGDKNNPVDIYLEDCQIYGRCRSSDGSQNTAKFPKNEVLIEASIGNVLGGKENINYMKGFSSIFVFSSTATDEDAPYRPTIHIRGKNHLRGQLGFITEVFAYVLGQKLTMDKITDNRIINVGTSSAPITIKPDNSNGYTHLTMDDFWPNSSGITPTNGYLNLDSYKLGEASRVPSIDMGSEFSSLTFNGGQYHLHNSASPDGEYTCNMAISYRKFYKEAEVLSVTPKVSLYGFGGDQAANQVIINSGTFTMEKNMYGTKGGTYYIDQDEYLDLRLPAGSTSRPSQINGGTFNGISHVVFCSEVASSGGSPINSAGEWLCMQDVPVNAETTSYGSATFDIPAPFYIYEEPMVVYDLDGNIEGVSTANQYGGQSANAYNKDGQSVVSLMLSGSGAECELGGCTDCEKLEESLYRNWATTIPRVQVTIAGVEAEVGGDEEVPYNKEGEVKPKFKVNQLMYMDLDGLQNQAIELEESEFYISPDVKPRGNFTNKEPYTILKHLNMVKVVQADRWYTFVAPFDIHRVEVLEIDERKVSAITSKADAMREQLKANAKFMIAINGFIIPNSEGRSSGLTFEEIVSLDQANQPKKLIKLKHYNGQKESDNNYGANILNANYYLYEAPEGELNKSETINGLDTFHIVWKPVHREGEAGQPLMKQGRVYAIQFPYCPMCAVVEENDYWSNKMIRFYGACSGKDGQTINGTDYQNTILAASPSEGNAMFKGNSTLADMTLVANAGYYVHNTTDDYFYLNNSSYILQPTEGFIHYTPKAGAQMPARISRSGQIEYDENAETGVDGVPTVGDRTSLMLFGAYDGFEVLALHEQLVTVYNLQGNVVFQQYMTAGEQVYVATGAGIFVVRGESEAIKVMVD